MSVKRVYRVAHARQRYAKLSTGERTEVKGRRGRSGAPMTRRVTVSDRERPLPNYTCGKCGVEIKVGDPYIYWEPYFRSSMKAIRCTKSTCYPRPSELDSSKMSTVLAAIEDANSVDTSTFTEASDFTGVLEDVVSALNEVAQEYRDADDNFGGGGNTQSGERADELEDQASDLENTSFDDAPEREDVEACAEANDENHPVHKELGHEGVNAEGCPECDDIWENAMDYWRQEQASNLQDALGNIA